MPVRHAAVRSDRPVDAVRVGPCVICPVDDCGGSPRRRQSAAVDMTLHLDPMSLAVWFEPPTHGDYTTRRLLSGVGELALLERHDEAEDLVAGIDDPVVRRAGVELLSNVWHEQRHFVDFVLTNYGALRLRDHLLTYVNAGGLLSEAVEGGRPLMVPLSTVAAASGAAGGGHRRGEGCWCRPGTYW